MKQDELYLWSLKMGRDALGEPPEGKVAWEKTHGRPWKREEQVVIIKDDWQYILRSAVRLANFHHAGQKDLAGQPYIDHVLGVCERVEGIELKIIALLHDILEDTGMHEAELRRLMPGYLVDAVVTLTHKKGEAYAEYIMRVSERALARRVKIADLKDNLDPGRPLKSTPGSVARRERYHKALAELENIEMFGDKIDKEYGNDEHHWSQS